jgi:hypothetical protein
MNFDEQGEMTFNPLVLGSARVGLQGLGGSNEYILGFPLACARVNLCVAAAGPSDEITFDPAAPRRASAPVPMLSQGIMAAACPSATQCTAASIHGEVVTFDPSDPSHGKVATLTQTDNIMAMSCPSVRQCTMLASAGPAAAFTFNPQSLGHAHTVDLPSPPLEGPQGLSCPSANQCTAGAGVNELTFDPLN